jgi:hypothetical protein
VVCPNGYDVRDCLYGYVWVGYAWASTLMPVRIVGLVHTLSYRVGNQFVLHFFLNLLGVNGPYV